MQYDIQVQLRSPELASAIRMLAEAISGKPMPPLDKPIERSTPKESASETEQLPASDETEISFDEIHKALVGLKNRKNSAAVREILDSLGCKTAQDIPKEKFAEALRMVSSKLEG